MVADGCCRCLTKNVAAHFSPPEDAMRASPSLRSPTQKSSPRMVLLAVLAVAAAGCDYAEAPIGPPQFGSTAGEGLKGTIAFQSRRDGNPEIYSMNANGTGVARL